MKTTTIREVRDRTPFRPFEVGLADGRRFEVVAPDHVFVSPAGDEFVLYERDGTLHIIDASLVTSVTRRQRGRK